MAQKNNSYGNQSISSLKGADRVRKRPSVIFGSDGLEGCEHAVFEIMSNAIDEAREGHGDLITVTRFEDGSIQVEDQGRGCPVDWNETEQKFCLLYTSQCAGFLRVPESGSVLDNTGVHPESYGAAEKLLAECGYTLDDVKAGELSELKARAEAIGLAQLAERCGAGLPTLSDIIKELMKPGRDPRDEDVYKRQGMCRPVR